MAAAKHNLTADRGARFSLAVRYKDSVGVPVNLTGYTAGLVVTTRAEAPTTLLSVAGSTNAQGQITINATDEDTSLWPSGNHAYRVELSDPAGNKDFILIGGLRVRSAADV